ncbi:hypothetical protein [Larkinella soli]|uniref:hypothetical protein n=1 Tax=Larkinella soli TaxID=1770527 RepID=UPI000FFC2F99|nr:hypothetical protein [Larkinella soli]
MKIKQRHLQKYMHDIAVEQLAADYSEKGYKVSKEEPIGQFRVDLVARKGNETILIEVKAGSLTPEKKSEIQAIGDFVKNNNNYRFLIAIATPPKEKKIEIENLDRLLFLYISEHVPEDLSRLTHFVSIQNVMEVDPDEIITTGSQKFRVVGDGIVTVNLRNESGEALKHNSLIEESFPFTFEVILTNAGNEGFILSQAIQLTVDVSSVE